VFALILCKYDFQIIYYILQKYLYFNIYFILIYTNEIMFKSYFQVIKLLVHPLTLSQQILVMLPLE